jgi:hypothetical protein
MLCFNKSCISPGLANVVDFVTFSVTLKFLACCLGLTEIRIVDLLDVLQKSWIVVDCQLGLASIFFLIFYDAMCVSMGSLSKYTGRVSIT